MPPLFRVIATFIALTLLLVACDGQPSDEEAAQAGDGATDAATGAATADEQITITVTQWPSGSYTPPYALGMEEGIFQDHSIEIDGVLPGAGGGTTVRNLLAGDLAFGEVAFPAAVQAFLSGAPLRIIGGGVRTAGELAYVTRPDEPFESLEDLVGHDVGYTNPGSVTQTMSFLLMDAAGLPYDEINWEAAGGVSEGLTLLEAGELDAHIISEPQHTIEVGEGRWKTVFRTTEYIPALQQTVLLTSPELIEENPELVENFLAAYGEATERVYADPAAAGRAWAAEGDFAEEASVETVEQLVDVEHWSVALDVEGMNTMLEGMLAGEVLDPETEIPWVELVNQDFLPEDVTRVDLDELALGAQE